MDKQPSPIKLDHASREENPVGIAVVGAGAAGLMAAIWAGRTAIDPGRTKDSSTLKSINIVLFDTKPKIGAKILMSGGTRCNVTNQDVKPSDFQGGPSHFVKHVLEAFTPQETIRFFKEIGVELILEPSGKYFPVTHSAKTILDALTASGNKIAFMPDSAVVDAIRFVEENGIPNNKHEDYKYCNLVFLLWWIKMTWKIKSRL